MLLEFQFFGFDPDDDLQKNARRSLDQLLNQSPNGSLPVALLEKTEDGFRCAIDLYTQHGPLIAQACQSTPSQALSHVCDTLQKKLVRWKDMQLRAPRTQEIRLLN